MKFKNIGKITLAALVCSAVCLAGCLNSGNAMKDSPAAGYATDEKFTTENGLDMVAETAQDSIGAKTIVLHDEKKIYRADLNCETTNFDGTTQKIHDLVKEYDAYFETDETSVSQRKINADDFCRNAYMMIRVPAEKFEAFQESLDQQCDMMITRKNITAENITDQYYDVSGRLELYKNKQEKLTNMIKDAANVSELIEIENALSDVEYQIDYLQGLKNDLDSRISYSTVSLNVREVTALTMSVRASTYGNKLLESFTNGCINFVRFFANIGLFIAGHCLFIIMFVLVFLGLKKGYFRIKGRECKINFCLRKRQNESEKDTKK